MINPNNKIVLKNKEMAGKKITPKTMRNYKPSPYKESMCADLIKRFAKGETRVEFCAAYNLSEETFSVWVKRRPDFSEAYRIAKTKAMAWYVNIGREHIIEEPDGPRLNMAMYNRTMNTRFHLPSHRKIKIKGIASEKKVQDKMNALLYTIEEGELTSAEAVQMARVVESTVKVNEHSELEDSISQIEQAQKIGVGDEDFEKKDT